jgi:vacuolar-type H+-ATPase subunit H
MHQASEQPEFMRTVKEIKDAEEAYDRLISAAKEKAEKAVREAKEKSIEERMKGEEAVTAYRNERIRKGSKEIEDEVGKLLAAAREDAEKLGKRKADQQAVSRLVKEFLDSL